MHLSDISILGLGYLGLPLAQKFYEQGSQVAAVKRNLTSDNINLPIELDIIDLNQDDIFHSSALWQNHINKPTWFCLLPPSSLNHYADTLKKWIQLAEQSKVQHIIFTSSTSVYGNQARICDETTPPDPQTESARQILTIEQALLESAVPPYRHTATGWTLFCRPSSRYQAGSKNTHSRRQSTRQYSS